METIRKCIIQVAMMTHTGMDYLFGLPLAELTEIIRSITEIKAKRKEGG